MIQRQPNATDVIAALNLEPHVEGGITAGPFSLTTETGSKCQAARAIC